MQYNRIFYDDINWLDHTVTSSSFINPLKDGFLLFLY